MWDGRGAVTSTACRCADGDDDPAGEEMQALLDAAGQLPVLDVEIFGVADDGVADMGRVRSELVGTAGDGLERSQESFWAAVSTTA
jgi:hypothetical protein